MDSSLLKSLSKVPTEWQRIQNTQQLTAILRLELALEFTIQNKLCPTEAAFSHYERQTSPSQEPFS